MSATDTEPRMLDFEVVGMTCASCAARVQRTLGKHPGVVDAEVNFATGRARVAVGPGTSVEALQSAVDRIGYGLAPTAEPTDEHRAGRRRRGGRSARVAAPDRRGMAAGDRGDGDCPVRRRVRRVRGRVAGPSSC